MAREVRFDRNPLREPRVDQRTGRVRFDGVFTRAGIFRYRNADGTERAELRTPEEVRASLPSLELMPVIDNHPPTADGLIDPREAQRPPGVTLEGARMDGDNVVGAILVTDSALLSTIKHRKNALSVGYTVDYDPTPGTHPVYGKYDGVQRNIRGDHLAVVDAGRAGPEARIRVDGVSLQDRCEIPSHANSVPGQLRREETQVKLTGKAPMDEIQELKKLLQAATTRADAADARAVEADKRANAAEGKAEQIAADFEKLKATRSDSETIAARDAEITALKTRVDALEGELKVAKDPERFRVAVLKRTEIETKGRAVLGDRFRADMTEREIMGASLAKLVGDEFAGKPDEYVAARFDTAVDGFLKTEKALSLAPPVVVVRADQAVDTRTERQKMIARKRGELKE
jgi:hypothetical protein